MSSVSVKNTRLYLPAELHSKLMIAKANLQTELGKGPTLHNLIVDILDKAVEIKENAPETSHGFCGLEAWCMPQALQVFNHAYLKLLETINTQPPTKLEFLELLLFYASNIVERDVEEFMEIKKQVSHT